MTFPSGHWPPANQGTAGVLTTGVPSPPPPSADSWVSVSWDGMLARGTAACLYFVAWIVIGNFVLLTLFLAILITNFQVRPGEGGKTQLGPRPSRSAHTGMTRFGLSFGLVEHTPPPMCGIIRVPHYLIPNTRRWTRNDQGLPACPLTPPAP